MNNNGPDFGFGAGWTEGTPYTPPVKSSGALPRSWNGKNKPLALCPASCGCLWVNNEDGTMSLFGGNNSKSCDECEMLPWDKLLPVTFGVVPASDAPVVVGDAWMKLAGLIRAQFDKLQDKVVAGELDPATDAEWSAIHAAIRGLTCGCWSCQPNQLGMVLCPTCGNKRCPKANNHRNTCTNSNEPGQAGSSYSDQWWMRDCQSGSYDVCRAASQDGICCAADECDIDAGIRKDNAMVNWNDRERAAIAKLMEEQGLSELGLLRQCLRYYQADHEKRKAGETVVWSGDAQRTADFMGPLLSQEFVSRVTEPDAEPGPDVIGTDLSPVPKKPFPRVVLELPDGDTRKATVFWTEWKGEDLHVCITVSDKAAEAISLAEARALNVLEAWDDFCNSNPTKYPSEENIRNREILYSLLSINAVEFLRTIKAQK